MEAGAQAEQAKTRAWELGVKEWGVYGPSARWPGGVWLCIHVDPHIGGQVVELMWVNDDLRPAVRAFTYVRQAHTELGNGWWLVVSS